jgi:hypothetical protein
MSTARLLQAYFARKGFGFAVCGNNRASVSRFVAGIGHSRFRYARLELKGQIGVGVVNWDWGTGMKKSSNLLSYGDAFGTAR